jgi:competence protein ComGC
MGYLSFLKEFWSFLKVRKRFWLLPVVVVLILIGLLVILAESSVVAPFIYTLF